MKHALLLAILVLAACKGQPTHWPRAVECAVPSPELADAVSEVLLRDGQDDALSSESKRDLVNIGAGWGMQAASCAVTWLVDTWLRPKVLAATEGPVTDTSFAARRGAAFLAEQGIR